MSTVLSFAPLPSLTTRKFGGISAFKPSASLALNSSNSYSMSSRCRRLHCSPLTTSTSFGSSFSGSSLGLDSSFGINVSKKRGHGLVVKAGKYALSQTKRSRSRKSLARVHGFRKRMSTTSGKAVLKRRRAKGRWVLCSKSNPRSGKRS